MAMNEESERKVNKIMQSRVLNNHLAQLQSKT